MNSRIIFFILPAILFSCKKNETASDAPSSENGNTVITISAEQFNAAGIALGHLDKKMLSETVSASGMLDVPPQNLVTISAPMGGFVKHTHLLQGMYVKKGEALIELQDPRYIQLQQDFLESQSQLEFAQTEYKRQEALAIENVNSEKTVQQAKSQYLGLKAKVEGLKATLAMININPADIEKGIRPTITIYSPINGYVTEVNVNIGKYVNGADMIFKIVDTSHLHAELYIFEQDISKISVGQKVHFNLINEMTDRLATIHLVGKEISSERTIRVHCHLAKEDPLLLPGMYLKARIETGAHESIVLPDEALVNFEGVEYIFITDDSRIFSMLSLKTGTKENGFTEVITPDNITENTQIVIKGAYELLSLSKNTEDDE